MKEKNVFLIYGEPGSGKSFLANRLEKEHSNKVISTDDLYLEFVKSQCPGFYFDNLKNYISEHYQRILVGPYTERKYLRNLDKEWQRYLVQTIFEGINSDSNLIVEGYLVGYCMDEIEAFLKDHARIFRIHVNNNQYQLEIPVSIDGIIALCS